MDREFDADVLVIGSGFGGSVAALRFAQAGERVVVLERGRHVRREEFQADLDAFWNPARHRFGMNQLRARGDTIIPWLGAAVGGGSHVYAATLKRRESFAGFPEPVASEDMTSFYDRAESMLDAQPFPDWPPYSDVRATQLLYRAGQRLSQEQPELVEDWGPIRLGISFAPPGAEPGADFVNKHGATQRYSDPAEQSLLGGDIDAKNSLDRNYLHLAQEAGAQIRELCEADRIEPLPGGGYQVRYARYRLEDNPWRRLARQWSPFGRAPDVEPGELRARRVVVSAGAIGSTELLLRNRDVHGTLPSLSPRLGERYSCNGDTLSLIFPFRGIFVSWAGLLAVVLGLMFASGWLGAAGVAAYYAGLWSSRGAFDPDIGPTNSDFIRFRGEDGQPQGVYIEGGRYPTPLRLGFAVVLSTFGLWQPRHYAPIIRITRFLRRYVPPFDLISRSWPIPLLTMGRDHAHGTFTLDAEGRATIDFDLHANRPYYAYINRLGRRVARATHAWWLPNLAFRLLGKLEIPHNQGGATMGVDADHGVVDHAGRVFGYDDLMVLDGSIIPLSPGPNPALTILALAERAMEHVLAQVKTTGTVRAES